MGVIDLDLTKSDHIPWDTHEAAEYLGCSAGYLKKLRQIGGGPEYDRIGIRKGGEVPPARFG